MYSVSVMKVEPSETATEYKQHNRSQAMKKNENVHLSQSFSYILLARVKFSSLVLCEKTFYYFLYRIIDFF